MRLDSIRRTFMVILAVVPGQFACGQRSVVEGGMPRVSADGKRIAYFVSRDIRGSSVWVVNADGSEPRELTSLWRNVRYGNWAPDGRLLAIIRPDGDSAGIYSVDVTSGQIKLMTRESNVRWVAWSPDGKQFVFAAGSAPNIGLAVVNVDGRNRRALTNEAKVHFGAVWSPDGSAIAYSKSGAGIWVMKADGSDAHQVSPEGEGPSWSPSGEWIAYTKTVMAPKQPGEQWAKPKRADIMVVHPDGSGARAITSQTDDMIVETPSWFPDGRTLAVQVQRANVTSLHVLDLNGRLVRSLTGK